MTTLGKNIKWHQGYADIDGDGVEELVYYPWDEKKKRYVSSENSNTPGAIPVWVNEPTKRTKYKVAGYKKEDISEYYDNGFKMSLKGRKSQKKAEEVLRDYLEEAKIDRGIDLNSEQIKNIFLSELDDKDVAYAASDYYFPELVKRHPIRWDKNKWMIRYLKFQGKPRLATHCGIGLSGKGPGREGKTRGFLPIGGFVKPERKIVNSAVRRKVENLDGRTEWISPVLGSEYIEQQTISDNLNNLRHSSNAKGSSTQHVYTEEQPSNKILEKTVFLDPHGNVVNESTPHFKNPSTAVKYISKTLFPKLDWRNTFQKPIEGASNLTIPPVSTNPLNLTPQNTLPSILEVPTLNPPTLSYLDYFQ